MVQVLINKITTASTKLSLTRAHSQMLIYYISCARTRNTSHDFYWVYTLTHSLAPQNRKQRIRYKTVR